jgi:dolichol-phosphate mannosyltransferase
MCGFFAIGRSRLLELAPQTSGFKIVFETMLRARGALRVREVPIVFRERARGKSKMSFDVAVRFFFRWLHAMFEHLASSQRESGVNMANAAEALHPEAPGE